MDKKITLQIPDQLLKDAKTKLRTTPFATIDDLVIYLLQSYLDKPDRQKSSEATADEEAEIKKRLKNLGYL